MGTGSTASSGMAMQYTGTCSREYSWYDFPSQECDDNRDNVLETNPPTISRYSGGADIHLDVKPVIVMGKFLP